MEKANAVASTAEFQEFAVDLGWSEDEFVGYFHRLVTAVFKLRDTMELHFPEELGSAVYSLATGGPRLKRGPSRRGSRSARASARAPRATL